MTLKEIDGALHRAWVKNVGWKLPLTVISTLVIFVIWESTPASFLSYSQLSASQIQSFLSRPASQVQSPANTSSDSTPDNVPTVHTDSPGTDSESQPKKRPVETIEPDPNSRSPVDTTTVSEPTAKPVNSTSNAFPEDDTQLQPVDTTATAVTEAPTNPINATSDAFVEEDTQLVDAATVEDDPQQPAAEEKKYIVPLLSYQVGTGNQLMEYKSAAVIARTLNRTLCLIPFFGGPPRHFGYLGDRKSGLVMEDRYDTEVLSKFVKVASIEECMQQCNWKLDVHWRLRNGRPPHWDQWFNDTPLWSVNFNKEYSKWSSTADLESAMGPRNEAHCVGLGGLFPGLRWRGVVIAASTYMEHSHKVKKAADLLQARAIPDSEDNDFISVHWRFEESKCSGHPLGLCFSRCSDGAVIANGRRSDSWANMTREEGTGKGYRRVGFNGVFVTREDISGTIYDRAVKFGVKNVYLATDGWLRGPESRGIVKWVVEDVRSKGLNIAGLWMIADLPNFADGYYVESRNMADLFGLDKSEIVSTHMIALVEQEICLRSSVFLGSGQSTWSLAVADTRRGRRCKKELNQQISGLNLATPPEVLEQAIIEKILTIQFVAGPTCRGAQYNFTMQKYEDEAPDGWLDYDACEVRLLNGVGQCRRIST